MNVKLRIWAPATVGALIAALILDWWFVQTPRPGVAAIPLPAKSSEMASVLAPPAPEAPAPIVHAASPPLVAPPVPSSIAPPVAPSAPRIDVARIMPNGEVVVAGRTEQGAKVRLLDGGQVLLEARADPATGEFVLLPPRLGVGAHQLSVQSTGLADGAKTSEIAVQSFSISPQIHAAVTSNPAPPVPSVVQAEPRAASVDAHDGKATIARGDSLWRISRARLGRGALFKLIYQANLKKIRDPNLIYPNQTLTIP